MEIHKRATALLQDTAYANSPLAARDVSESSMTPFTSREKDHSLAQIPVATFPPSTCCIKDTIGTRELSWTLRGEDEAVSHRIQRVLAFLDKLKAAAQSPQATSESWCTAHNQPCTLYDKNGQSWLGHPLPGGNWCRYKDPEGE